MDAGHRWVGSEGGGVRYTSAMTRPDPHSVFDDAQPRVRRLDWRARFDFAARVIEAEARLTIDGAGEANATCGTGETRSAIIDLDARDLTIERVSDEAGARLDVELAAPHSFLGQRLRIARPPRIVCIRYRTSPAATALHWFNQSAQWSNQFVYSQCQPIYARTLVPLADSPSSRIAYRAALTAPRALTALMAATFVAREEHAGDAATTTYEMVEPIAPYLLAFAIGEFTARELSPRSRVWAEPALVDAAAREFAEVERCWSKRSACSAPTLGALRSVDHAAVVSLWRHGESAADLPHADAARRRARSPASSRTSWRTRGPGIS